MKRTIRHAVLFLVGAACLTAHLFAQNSREVIHKAMRDELKRNVERLELEQLRKPFFISYDVRDVHTMNITASLGALVRSNEMKDRQHNVRVMVGSYERNDENFFDINRQFDGESMGGESDIPIENDYEGIRRALWFATDKVYKRAAENYERKVAAINQQNLSEEDAALADFSKAPQAVQSVAQRTFPMTREKWERMAVQLSGIFTDYPDIYSSLVQISIIQTDLFFVNSEGTEVVYPVTLAAVLVNASTQAPDGQPLRDRVKYYALLPSDLPSEEAMKKEVISMAKQLTALRTAPLFDQTYSGPVLFEGEAVGEMIAQRFFSGSAGLIASRKPIYSDPQASFFLSRLRGSSLEDKLGTRILPKEISIKAVPTLAKYDGIPLIGSYEMDAEGIRPPKELPLVDQGMLKTLLSNRIPSPKVSESNGHARPVLSSYGAQTTRGPGVIVVVSSAGQTAEAMKKRMIQLAKEQGLTHAVIVRKLSSSSVDESDDPSSSFMEMMNPSGEMKEGVIGRPVALYRVSVSDGREELVRGAELGGISSSALKRIVAAEKKQIVYQTQLASASDAGMGLLTVFLSGIGDIVGGYSASLIVPRSMLFDELEVKKEKRRYTPLPPVVPSPLVKQ